MSVAHGSVSLGLVALLLSLGCGQPDRDGYISAAPDGGFATSFATDAEALPPFQPSSESIRAVVTADNAYAFGWGDLTGPRKLNGRPTTNSAADIFSCPINATGSGESGYGPESYVIPGAEAPDDAYLYLVAWDDGATTQGTIGVFRRTGGDSVFTGTADWEVCATGKSYPTDTPPNTGGPSLAVVRADVDECTRGTGDLVTGSAGWVGVGGALPVTPDAVGHLAIGEDNSDNGGTFPLVCQTEGDGTEGIPANAHWMWYSPDDRNAFATTGTRAYLIFRLPAKAVPGPR